MVPQYFNILSKFNLLENLCIVLQIYAQSDVRCKGLSQYISCLRNYTHTQLNPYLYYLIHAKVLSYLRREAQPSVLNMIKHDCSSVLKDFKYAAL